MVFQNPSLLKLIKIVEVNALDQTLKLDMNPWEGLL